MKYLKNLVYLAHPYGGKEENKMDSIRIEAGLNAMQDGGYLIVNPLTDEGVAKAAANCDYREDMIRAYCGGVLSACDLIIFCPGWEDSPGCRYEYEIAKKRHIPRIFLNRHEAALIREFAAKVRMEAMAA